MTFVLELVVALAIVIGAIFTFVGSFGLVKLREPMSRLHAPTKAGTLGVGAILVASMLYAYSWGEGSLHELLIMAFLFVTAPVSAYFIAKVVIHRNRYTQALPPPGEDTVWATKIDSDAEPKP